MCKFFPITPLKAGNFDSETATDGHVLTADGAGGAAWEAGGGGGGASFIFDGATFTPGDFTADSGMRLITVELTKGGNSIASGVAWVVCMPAVNNTFTPPLYQDGGGHNLYLYDAGSVNYPSWNIPPNSTADTWSVGIYVPASGGKMEFTLTVGNDDWDTAQDAYIIVNLPSGGVAVSDAISIPGYVAA